MALPSDTLRSFLLRAAQSVKKVQNGSIKSFPGGRVSIVSGNQSADMDSVVGSILYAALHWIFHNPNGLETVSNNSNFLLPYVNIPREDLKLRRDICHLLTKYEVSLESLLFSDDLPSQLQRENCLDVVLVDHNVPQSSLAACKYTVVGIIDHHVDDKLFESSIAAVNGPRIVQHCGSCTSLIFNYWYGKFAQESRLADLQAVPQLAVMALGPILLDTNDLTMKTEPADLTAVRSIAQVLQEQPNFTHFYQELAEAKQNLVGLSGRDILRKDYKEWTPSCQGQQVTVGISSVIKSSRWLAEHVPEFFQEASSWLAERKLDVLVVLNAATEAGTFSRELGVLANQGTEKSQVFLPVLINQLTEKLKLEPISHDFGSQYLLFRQGNLSAGRKVVAPLVVEAIESV